MLSSRGTAGSGLCLGLPRGGSGVARRESTGGNWEDEITGSARLNMSTACLPELPACKFIVGEPSPKSSRELLL